MKQHSIQSRLGNRVALLIMTSSVDGMFAGDAVTLTKRRFKVSRLQQRVCFK